MLKKAIENGTAVDLLIAVVCGSCIGVGLGLPSMNFSPEPMTSAVEQQGEAEVAGELWTKWSSGTQGPLVCPPGLAGFLISTSAAPGQQLVCGFSAQRTEIACDDERGVLHVCRPETAALRFYEESGLKPPDVFAGCCASPYQALCRFTEDNERFKVDVSCGL